MAGELSGKVFLVTGATEGIGKAAALEFARRGADLVIVGRDAQKTAKVAAELKAASGNERVETLLGDLSKPADVRAVAKEFRAKHDRLDVLVNNAGAVFTKRELTPDGFEKTFALNHLAYFVLTVELLDLLKKTPGARVVSTSSGAHFAGTLADLDAVARGTRFGAWRAYGDSKLANILFTRELARRAGPGVVASCFHPGYVRSGFGLNNQSVFLPAAKLAAKLFARTPEKGAETLVWLATSPEAAGASGEYFADMKPTRRSGKAKDDKLAAELWEFSERLCGVQ